MFFSFLRFQERCPERTAKLSTGSLGRQDVKGILGENQEIPQERTSCCFGEQTIDGLVSRDTKEVVEVVPLFPQESIQQRTPEEIDRSCRQCDVARTSF